MLEIPCGKEDAAKIAADALARGAVGAVTSWGSGMGHRDTVRLYWDGTTPSLAEIMGDEFSSAEDLAEEDWGEHWRETLRPFRAGSRFLLTPSWETPDNHAAEWTLFIDPGMAFGAGDHPTTRLCVAALENISEGDLKGSPLLDLGAGTGVLALAAARLGFGPVDALDIDPFCHASIGRNIRLNRLDGRVTQHLLSLDLYKTSHRLAVANVAPNQLLGAAPLLAERLLPGGLLVLSGFQSDWENRIMDAYGDDFRLLFRLDEGEWLALGLERLWSYGRNANG